MSRENTDFEVLDYTNNKYENLKPQMSFSAKNIQQAQSWQKLLRSKLIDLIGGLPEKRKKLSKLQKRC